MSVYINEAIDEYNNIHLQDFIQSDNKKIYHYTSPAGFQGIITNRTLRFTDRFFLNDYTEGVYVLDLCIENLDFLVPNDRNLRKELCRVCKKQKEKMNEANIYVYQCSFSLDGDNLSLWNYYTKGDSIRGYNLCFESRQISKKLHLKQKNNEKLSPLYGVVVYEKQEQLNIIRRIIEKFQRLNQVYPKDYQFTIGLLVQKLLVIGTFFKNPCFSVEHEFRIVFNLGINGLGSFVQIQNEKKYFEKGGILIPCIDVEFESDALKGIGISPTLDFETTKSSIYRATEINFPQIKENKDSVYPSKIPVRY